MDALLTKHYSPGTRAGVFFISLGFTYSSVISSIYENSLPAGNDLAALLPHFITIRRGFYIAAVISYCHVPLVQPRFSFELCSMAGFVPVCFILPP